MSAASGTKEAATGPLGAGAAAWARLRAAHPVAVLRWLRAGVLAMVCATAVVYLMVAGDGGQQITSARRADAAVKDIRDARVAAKDADKALKAVADIGQIQLTGTGNEFANAAASISTLVTAAAQGNAAGKRGTKQISYVQNQLTAFQQAADTADDSAAGNRTGVGPARTALNAPHLNDPETKQPLAGTGGLRASLKDLERLQRAGLERQRDEGWLDPVQLWCLAALPPAVMLALVLVTGRLLARHFHRYVSPRLLAALVVTTGVAVTTAALTAHDENRLAAQPWAGEPGAMTLVLSALAAAAVLNHFAYRPRLAEYRYPRP
ncbi:hypothetical protein [Streptomyces sp. NBC_01304]|uniref:hypothetical protein n=1 Tax=Streptomyces sp. NBC_01304 TaxID=2903818 RepID=UPI002E0E2997|nr:hypothetical protein OG430_45930 [Streptomyces sp. NBC_01304]